MRLLQCVERRPTLLKSLRWAWLVMAMPAGINPDSETGELFACLSFCYLINMCVCLETFFRSSSCSAFARISSFLVCAISSQSPSSSPIVIQQYVCATNSEQNFLCDLITYVSSCCHLHGKRGFEYHDNVSQYISSWKNSVNCLFIFCLLSVLWSNRTLESPASSSFFFLYIFWCEPIHTMHIIVIS